LGLTTGENDVPQDEEASLLQVVEELKDVAAACGAR